MVIADHRKLSGKLGTAWKYVPIEVLPLAYQPVKAKIEVRMWMENKSCEKLLRKAPSIEKKVGLPAKEEFELFSEPESLSSFTEVPKVVTGWCVLAHCSQLCA